MLKYIIETRFMLPCQEQKTTSASLTQLCGWRSASKTVKAERL